MLLVNDQVLKKKKRKTALLEILHKGFG
jgi:hypothetical protein